MSATATERKRFQLSDDERSRIRWSSTKRGFVVLLEFEPKWGRRGPRPYQPIRSHVAVTRLDAEREAERMFRRFNRAQVVSEVTLFETDPLGRVRSAEGLGIHRMRERFYAERRRSDEHVRPTAAGS